MADSTSHAVWAAATTIIALGYFLKSCEGNLGSETIIKREEINLRKIEEEARKSEAEARKAEAELKILQEKKKQSSTPATTINIAQAFQVFCQQQRQIAA